MLKEDEQFERYTAVLKAMDGKPVNFRLLDIGSDKSLSFLDMPREENPSLGCRGARFLLERPDLLKTQARALARASLHGPVNVMYPMITDIEQFRKLKNMFNEAIADLAGGEINHGLMFEVVSAALQAREILKIADFGSIGSNDLIQYLFAVDRDNERVAYDYDPNRDVFWSLIGEIARAASEMGKPLSICGELAGEPKYIPKLIELGMRIVSVSPRLIPKVRMAAKQSLGAKKE
ncbi:MAG: putative PEP-binding protein [bacterium]